MKGLFIYLIILFAPFLVFLLSSKTGVIIYVGILLLTLFSQEILYGIRSIRNRNNRFNSKRSY